MDIIEVIILALIQGITEFLPISSSAHLILPAQVLGWQDQGLAFDVAVHVGSLLAVVLYFREDIVKLTYAWCGSFTSLNQPSSFNDDAKLAWCVAVGTVPALIAGLIANDYADQLRSTTVIATTTVVFGVLLAVADLQAKKNALANISYKTAILIGLAQCLALIPGTSRSGITMTMALFLGLSRDASARFSFLLSIPLILAAGGYKTLELVQSPMPVDWLSIALGTVLSAVSAYLCISLFLQAINRIGFMPFVVYRLLLGAALFIFFT